MFRRDYSVIGQFASLKTLAVINLLKAKINEQLGSKGINFLMQIRIGSSTYTNALVARHRLTRHTNTLTFGAAQS